MDLAGCAARTLDRARSGWSARLRDRNGHAYGHAAGNGHDRDKWAAADSKLTDAAERTIRFDPPDRTRFARALRSQRSQPVPPDNQARPAGST